ncbi:SDR family oxidoreductase [Maribacter cobaltidurans]|uniref:NAD(P)-dependent oxidoreductase n=1 Tax=Maribacter cobaltidurans TaxID=1178778 RepID=A0A223V409_9FLAO|nr:SDR family oxidoreductase [Maribacter cobaltidurans]ASV29860.1 NAD(P)-dependent oxidoreductase [Maribacter cobaltidurans]GGD91912.1 epimerase [Maribacter cobaltidurans]
MNKVIGVIGCGWLGLPLAIQLKEQGYTVKGTTTSRDKINTLSKSSITPSLIQISETEIEGDIADFLKSTDILVVNIPPRLRGKGTKENYVSKIALLIKEIEISTVSKVLFVSSTSVYGNDQGEVNEETQPMPTSESGKQLLKTEKLIRDNIHFESTIIRFAGLIGPDRHPVTMLSGRTNLSGGDAPTNLIHLDDCIGIITTIIEKNGWGELINGVNPEHPTKREYYAQMALKKNLQAPEYQENKGNNHKKITISNTFLTKNYRFLTPI